MSLGGGSAYKNNPLAALSDKLSAQGLTVVTSAGNDGADVCLFFILTRDYFQKYKAGFTYKEHSCP